MKHLYLLSLSLFWSIACLGQGNLSKPENTQNNSKEATLYKRCGTVERTEALRAANPSLPSDEAFERFLRKAMNSRTQRSGRLQAEQVVYLPVVVHVIHQGETVGEGSNISYEQVLSQIEVLNEDFRRKADTRGFNELAVGADAYIEFVLAEIDPQGNTLAEQGINRVPESELGISAPVSVDDMDNIVKPATFWDPTRYLNIWTVDLSDGLLGYAQFPTDSGLEGVDYAGMASAAETDGVVVLYNAFGSSDKGNFPLISPYDKGRTATHEVGHWLGLRHIWGDGGCGVDDYCSDTPASDGPNFECPQGATSCGSLDMIENYMDYTDDACMNIFTLNQKERMQTVLQFSPRRKELLNSDVIFVEDLKADFAADRLELRAGESVVFTESAMGMVNSRQWTFDGGAPASSAEQNPVVVYELPGTYSVRLSVSNDRKSHEELKESYILVREANWVNSAPHLVAEIKNPILQIQEQASHNLNELFADVDGHTLTYSLTVENSAVLEASLSGSLLSLKGLSGGKSALLITADDKAGGQTTARVEVAVNTFPETLGLPGNQLLQVNELRSFSWAEIFADKDGDALNYSFLADNNAVLEVTGTAASLNLKGLAGGTTAVKVIADDSRGGKAEVIFTVEVNQQPKVLKVPADKWLVLEKETLSLTLSEIFSDPEGAQLSYQLGLSEEGYLTYEFKAGVLSFKTRKAGTVNVELKATDDRQGTNSVFFSLGGHYAPHESTVLDRQEVSLGDTLAIKLAEYFSDADGDGLTFTASSRNQTLAAAVRDSQMELIGLSLGEAVVDIYVVDSKGGKFEKALAVNVVEPLAARDKLFGGLLTIYPNPFTAKLKLKLEGVKPGAYSLLVFDLQGRKVKAESWEQLAGQSEKAFDLNALPQGTYLLKVTNGEGVSLQRIVKQ